jgi:hypothetical protein
LLGVRHRLIISLIIHSETYQVSIYLRLREFEVYAFIFGNAFDIQLTLVISNSMGPWEKFESTVVRLKRSYENIGSVVNDKRETTRAKF